MKIATALVLNVSLGCAATCLAEQPPTKAVRRQADRRDASPGVLSNGEQAGVEQAP